MANHPEHTEYAAGTQFKITSQPTGPGYDRGLFEKVEINGKPLTIPARLPRLDKTPGGAEWPEPDIASHNEEAPGGMPGLSADEVAGLSGQGVIWPGLPGNCRKTGTRRCRQARAYMRLLGASKMHYCRDSGAPKSTALNQHGRPAYYCTRRTVMREVGLSQR